MGRPQRWLRSPTCIPECSVILSAPWSVLLLSMHLSVGIMASSEDTGFLFPFSLTEHAWSCIPVASPEGKSGPWDSLEGVAAWKEGFYKCQAWFPSPSLIPEHPPWGLQRDSGLAVASTGPISVQEPKGPRWHSPCSALPLQGCGSMPGPSTCPFELLAAGSRATTKCSWRLGKG